jgi:hypothetical protein
MSITHSVYRETVNSQEVSVVWEYEDDLYLVYVGEIYVSCTEDRDYAIEIGTNYALSNRNNPRFNRF